MEVQAYLSFEGRCEEALEFYGRALGARVEQLFRFREMPDAPPGAVTPANANKVMHACIRIGDTAVMASDGQCTGSASFQGITLALRVASEAEARRLFDALADGGQVQVPLGKTFFSPAFGMVADRFGVPWMVNVAVES